jgi:hypothetical protein
MFSTQKWTRITRDIAPREACSLVLVNVATDVRPAAVWGRISETGPGDALITCSHCTSIRVAICNNRFKLGPRGVAKNVKSAYSHERLQRGLYMN